MNEEIKNGVGRTISKATDIFVDPIKQRMSHPLVSSFALSWILINWRPIVYFIFAPDSIKEKIVFISVNFYSNDWWNILFYLVVPLSLSLIYISLFERITNKINKFKEKDILDKYDHEKTIGVKKYNSQRDIMIARRALNNVTSDNHTIEQLNLQIEALKSENATKDEHLTIAQIELEKRAEALVKVTEQRDSIDTKLFELQEDLIEKIRTFTSNSNEKDAVIVIKDDEIKRLEQELERINNLYNEIRDNQGDITILLQRNTDLKFNFNLLVKTIYDKLNKEQFISIISNIPIAGLSTLFRELTEKDYILANGRPMQKFRRRLVRNTYVNYEKLGEYLRKIDKNVLVYELNEEGNTILEIAFSHNSTYATIVAALDDFLRPQQ